MEKQLKKVFEQNNIPLTAVPYIIILILIHKKGMSLEEFITKNQLENQEIIRKVYSIYEEYMNKELIQSLDRIITEDININNYFYNSISTRDNNSIVITPEYVADLMIDLLRLNEESIILDGCCGAGALLNKAIMKKSKIIGIEKNIEMYGLSYLYLTLKQNKKAKIIYGDIFEELKHISDKVTHGILNPPYNLKNKGMEFVLPILNKLEYAGRMAVIVPSSVGNGISGEINKEILKKHTLFASIKMPVDLFVPYASVQTNIYIFVAHIPHDINTNVRIVDFTDDGMKRTKRGIIIRDSNKYNELKEILKYNEIRKIGN